MVLSVVRRGFDSLRLHNVLQRNMSFKKTIQEVFIEHGRLKLGSRGFDCDKRELKRSSLTITGKVINLFGQAPLRAVA